MVGKRNRDRNVDADHADVDAAGEVAGRVAVTGVDRDAVAIFVLHRKVEGFLVVLGANDGQDRAEDFGLVDFHVRRDVVEQAAADEIAVLVALELEVAAVDDERGALFHALVDEAADAGLGFLGDDRAHVGLLVGIGTDAQALDLGRQLLDEAVGGFLADRNGDVDGHAAFAGRTVAGAHQGVDGLVEVGVGHDDHVVLGAAEALGALAVGRGGTVDVAGDRRGADEGDGADVGMGDDAVDSGLVTVDDVEDACRQAGLDHQFGKADRQGRVALGGLEDEGIAAGNRRGEHPHRDHAREVERRDAGADADRLADRIHVDAGAGAFGELALGQMRNADDELADFEAADDVALGVLDRLAMFARDQHRQLVHVLVEQVDELHEDAGAALRVGGGPLRLRGLGGVDGGLQLRVARERDPGLNLARGGIVDVGGAAARARHMLAVDEMSDLVHGESSVVMAG